MDTFTIDTAETTLIDSKQLSTGVKTRVLLPAVSQVADGRLRQPCLVGNFGLGHPISDELVDKVLPVDLFHSRIISSPMSKVNRQTNPAGVQNAYMGTNTLGQRIKECRRELKMTQPYVAGRVGMSQPNLSELENDKYPTSSYVPQLAKLFGVNALWLSTGEGSKHPANEELSELALSIAREVMKLPKEKQLELKTWVAVEAAIRMAKDSQAPEERGQDRKSS